MANVAFTEAFRTNEFIVEIEGIGSPGVTKVSSLSEGEIDVIEQPDGGSNTIHKISSGIIKFGDITIERNMDGTKADDDFKKWFSTMFKTDGFGLGSKLRRNGAIIKKQNGQEKLRLVFEGAWIKSSKFSDLDAGTSGLFKQTIVLSIERMYRA